MLIGTVYLVIDKQTKLGMGTIDEAYVNNNKAFSVIKDSFLQ